VYNARRLTTCILLTACVTLTTYVTRAKAQELPVSAPGKTGFDAAKLQKVDNAAQRLVRQKKVAGAVVLVARNGKISHFEAYGKRDIANNLPMRRDTIFRIYSMTKPITTTAAMMLWEEGKFKLDDPVSKFIPAFAGIKVQSRNAAGEAQLVAPERAVTVRDLMRHTSGLTYGWGRTAVDQQYKAAGILNRSRDLKQWTESLAKLPLKFQPGSTFEYSVSIDVLGRLVEIWSGKTLDVFFAERIFTPLDMKDSGFFVPQDKLQRFAACYKPGASGVELLEAVSTSRYRNKPVWLSGGGGLVSTARDYARFLIMLAAGGELNGKRLLKTGTVKLMTRNHVPDKALPIGVGDRRIGVGFGLGFSVRMEPHKGDPGSTAGECRWGGAASTHFCFSPEKGYVIIALEQYMPFSRKLEAAVKPLVLDALK